MGNEDLEKFLSQKHKDVTLFDFDDKKIPCIIIDKNKFDNIMKKVAGKPISVETDLNILQDGLGHVFVKVTLQFLQEDLEEKFLIYANEAMDFFEALADSAMLALSSPHSEYGRSNVFMIQLPKPERAQDALEIIRKGLHK